MYAKLFSRIAQSSLMEEEIETRYCFMMLLAIADSGGDVIGTDVAIARTVNLPIDVFKRCVSALMSPDQDSNSQAHEGRRLVPSESGRGYLIVNYATYRSIKTADEKKSYMREYMQRYRKSKGVKDVTAVNKCKTPLSLLAHAEGEGETEGDPPDPDAPDSPPQPDFFHSKTSSPKKIPPTPSLRAGSVKEQKPTQTEMEEFAKSLGLSRTDGQYCFEKWMGSGWKNGGKPIVNWQMTMRSWKTAGYLPSQQQPRNGNSAAAFTAPPKVTMTRL